MAGFAIDFQVPGGSFDKAMVLAEPKAAAAPTALVVKNSDRIFLRCNGKAYPKPLNPPCQVATETAPSRQCGDRPPVGCVDQRIAAECAVKRNAIASLDKSRVNLRALRCI